MQSAAPCRPAGPVPLRRPGSVRRTTSIDTHWPNGFGEPMQMKGQARDLFTSSENEATIVAEGAFSILASARREILSIETQPLLAETRKLVGVRAGGASRLALNAVLGFARGTPLFQLLDDFAGASLVAGWVWSRWEENWWERMAEVPARSGLGKNGSMEGVCTGFAPGSSALGTDGGADHSAQNSVAVGSLVHPHDAMGWHNLPEQQGVAMRRARRIDVWSEDRLLVAEMTFQDSGTSPTGGRIAIHEYLARAEIDPSDMTVRSITADPRILPYRECPGAVANTARMIGGPVGAFREAVLETLPGALGCTHLNDVLRSLADVPALANSLREMA